MKTPLVLLSGLLSSKDIWGYQASHLGDIASVQVLTSTQNTPEKMVKAILDQAPPKFALAGHSMGGWLCLEIMRTAPSRVTKLCLLNTTARSDSEEKLMRRKAMITKCEKGQFHEVIQDVFENFVYNPQVKNKVKEMFLEVGKETFVAQEQAMILRSECESILPTIKCPTLVIHARQDRIFSIEEHVELVKGIANAKLAVIEDSGHMSPMEMPQAVTALLRFWLTNM